MRRQADGARARAKRRGELPERRRRGKPQSPSVAKARFSYLEAAVEYEPRMLPDLKESAFDLYVAARKRYAPPDGGADADVFLADKLARESPIRDDLAAVRAALWGWAERWHLAEEWGVRAALEAMADWCAPRPAARKAVDVLSDLVNRMREQLRVVPPSVVHGGAAGLSWGIGGTLFPSAVMREKRRARTRSRDHFGWIVRYQVAGESYGEIARAPGARRRWRGRLKVISARAVEKAVKSLATRIGLRLREPGKGGRPRKRV